MVKICPNAFFGLIGGHAYVYNSTEDRRVCAKCGFYEKLHHTTDYDEGYDSSEWNSYGVVDDQKALIKKWGQEKKSKREQEKRTRESEMKTKKRLEHSENHRQIKWEDA